MGTERGASKIDRELDHARNFESFKQRLGRVGERGGETWNAVPSCASGRLGGNEPEKGLGGAHHARHDGAVVAPEHGPYR